MVDKIARPAPYMVYTGIAAEDLKEDSTVLEVIIAELSPHAINGDIGASITKIPIKLQDRDGKTISSQAVASNHIVCTWKGSSNSRVPPLVRKGEPVEVCQVAGQDKWEWSSTGKGRDFRTTDRHYIEIGATDPSQSGVEKNDTNTYSAYLDSVSQKVGMKTSMVNGEAAAFSMEADLKKGTFHVSDNGKSPNNRIFLDTGATSGTPLFQVNLSTGAVFKMEGDNAYLTLPKGLFISAKDRIVLDSPITIINTSNKGTVIINAASIAINSAKDFIVTAAMVGLNTASTKLTGVIIAAAGRIANIVKGSVGGGYTASKINDPTSSPVAQSSNSADTSVSGSPYD